MSFTIDLAPAIALFCEESDIDLMTRGRYGKSRNLVNMKLIAESYGYMGFQQAWGGFFAYYTVMYDFGFRPADLNWKASLSIVEHAQSDVYNPTDPFFGNSNLQSHYSLKCPTIGDPNLHVLDWIYNKHASQDLRMTALNC
jgi:sodium/potassium-transporting ATPase subunit alpha